MSGIGGGVDSVAFLFVAGFPGGPGEVVDEVAVDEDDGFGCGHGGSCFVVGK